MKKGILVLLFLSLVGVAFAQKKTAKKTKKAKPKTAVKATPTPSIVTNVSSTDMVDLNKKAAATPLPLDRPMDGYYKKSNITSAQPVAYAQLREADVIFAKRIWREIDLREKMNAYMASPQARLVDILVDAIKNDELRAFDATPTKADPGGDSFLTPLTSAQAMSKLSDSVLVSKTDTAGNQLDAKKVANDFNPDSVVRFRIKEDWIFDKQRSVFEPRIIGIAPLIQINAAGTKLDYQPAFWIYFPEARAILATREVFTKNNDASNLSYDQVFLKRIFSSYIVKVSNDKDERIKDYAQGIDRLYESERIKKIFIGLGTESLAVLSQL